MHLVIGPQRSRSTRSSSKGQPVRRPGEPHETADRRPRLLRASHPANDHHKLGGNARVGKLGAKFFKNNSGKKPSRIGDFRVQSQSSETEPTTVRILF